MSEVILEVPKCNHECSCKRKINEGQGYSEGEANVAMETEAGSGEGVGRVESLLGPAPWKRALHGAYTRAPAAAALLTLGFRPLNFTWDS